jgi:hypothetical protein
MDSRHTFEQLSQIDVPRRGRSSASAHGHILAVGLVDASVCLPRSLSLLR